MTDEHTIAIVSFEGAIKRAVKQLRQKLLPASGLGLLPSNYMNLHIIANGRINDGEIEISFTLSSCPYNTEPVKGNQLAAVTEELLRRAGWNKVNAPLAISFTKVEPPQAGTGNPPDDEIPF